MDMYCQMPSFLFWETRAFDIGGGVSLEGESNF